MAKIYNLPVPDNNPLVNNIVEALELKHYIVWKLERLEEKIDKFCAKSEFDEYNNGELIDKACEWLNKHMPFGETSRAEVIECINDFKKAMEL